jgi:hypothetical protein
MNAPLFELSRSTNFPWPQPPQKLPVFDGGRLFELVRQTGLAFWRPDGRPQPEPPARPNRPPFEMNRQTALIWHTPGGNIEYITSHPIAVFTQPCPLAPDPACLDKLALRTRAVFARPE